MVEVHGWTMIRGNFRSHVTLTLINRTSMTWRRGFDVWVLTGQLNLQPPQYSLMEEGQPHLLELHTTSTIGTQRGHALFGHMVRVFTVYSNCIWWTELTFKPVYLAICIKKDCWQWGNCKWSTSQIIFFHEGTMSALRILNLSPNRLAVTHPRSAPPRPP